MKGTKVRLQAPELHDNDTQGQRQRRKHTRRALARIIPATGTRHYNRWAWLYRP